MEWPRRSVETTPREQFQPPHCPHRFCPQHRIFPRYARFRFKRNATYVRQCDGRRIARFRCNACGRGFSSQSFAVSYYAKRPELIRPTAKALCAGSAHRQIARSFGCNHSTISRISARLGRHCILLQALALQHLSGIHETLALDSFETFVSSQLDALGLATLVGHESWFVYGIDPAPHRRGGRLTPAQQRKLRRRKRPLPARGGVKQSLTRVFDLLQVVSAPRERLTLHSDKHPACPPALAAHALAPRTTLRTFPNPKRGPKGSPRSLEARIRDAAMFAVDVLHRILRHTLAHHRRETIAFGRRINAVVEGVWLVTTWRNFVKGRSERKPDRRTPAMLKGLTDEPWSWERVLAQRLFPDRIRVPEPWMKVYRRDWDTEQAGPMTRHRRINAY
jgi:transposase-like protein